MTIPEEKFFRAQVTERVDFAPDLWMFRIRSGGEFKFVPGQYATLGVETTGKRVERPYSIASSPTEDEIEFFFELVPEGALTPLLHSAVILSEAKDLSYAANVTLSSWCDPSPSERFLAPLGMTNG